MKTGKCPLCLQEKQLLRSHLIPAAMYDYCRPPGGHHISIGSDLVIESDRQLQDYLLCAECEDDLNKGGETWLLPLLAQYKGPFPFHNILSKFPPDIVDGDTRVYAAARNPEIQTDKLIHFAMGVFWKAAVHSWSGSRTEPMIDLGEFAEPIRKFLRGEAGFPDKAALTIGVLPPPVRLISFHNPYQGSSTNWRNFLFYVSGIELTLLIGDAVEGETRSDCFACHPAHPILVVDFSKAIEDILRTVWAGARVAKNVEKYVKNPPPQ